MLSDIAQLSTIRYNEFHAAQPSANSPQQHPQQQHSRACWQPPPLDLYKINYDGATFDSENMSGIGVVIQDSQGSAVAALSQQLPHRYHAAEIETLAATRALEFALDIGIRCSAGRGFYAGCSTISADTISLSLGSLIVDAKSFTSCFNELHYSHTKRKGNKVAHSLARHA